MSSSKPVNPKRASGDRLNNLTANSTTTNNSATGSRRNTADKPLSTTTTSNSAAVKKTNTNTSTTGVTKGVASLKVSDNSSSTTSSNMSSTSTNRRDAGLPRRRGDDEKSDGPTTPSSSSSSLASAGSTISSSSAGGAGVPRDKAAQARRRLSIAASKNQDQTQLDGTSSASLDGLDDKLFSNLSKAAPAKDGLSVPAKDNKGTHSKTPSASSIAVPASKRPFASSHYLSQTGYVPFNPHKVNQDRFVAIESFANQEDKAFFGVFDGHGAVGHEVSAYLIVELPKTLSRQATLQTSPATCLSTAFVDTNQQLARSSIDCTFSGSTAIVCYVHGKKLYSANAGDSRAVLAKLQASPSGELKHVAVALSSDQKPEREDEKKRIIECKGRVEACKGPRGEDIGPPRVWLSHQDVPGLAMTRSFGDLVAASVGVIAKPEIWERDITADDKFLILASDGVWEFISNQEAVDIAVAAMSVGGPDAAVKALVEESTKRWHQEEEVVDDITCLIVML